jgi:putative peptidoglycan lipid II flippase
VILRRILDGLEITSLISSSIRICIAAAALAAVSFGIWDLLDSALGRGLVGQIVSLGAGLGLGALAYLGAAKMLRIAELEQIVRLLRRR